MPIRAVIFDLDGTITQPYFDFDAIREEIGLRMDAGPVLEAMESMTPEQRRRANKILHRHERQAVAASQLNPGAREVLQQLRQQGIHIGVLTRNKKANAEAIAAKHDLLFDRIVGREDGPVKPDAFGVRCLCEHFGVRPRDTLVVGDYLFDMLCAKAAGAIGVLITNHGEVDTFVDEADFTIAELGQLLPIIEGQDRREATRP